MEVDQDDEEKEKTRHGQVISDLSRALLQIEQGVDQKYLSPPLGKLTCLNSRKFFNQRACCLMNAT